jgi:hypothetical protein
MANLSASQRKAVPTSQFGLPAKARSAGAKAKSGNYPMPDKAHARSALRLMHNASPAEQKQIRAKANRVLGKSSSEGAERPERGRERTPERGKGRERERGRKR